MLAVIYSVCDVRIPGRSAARRACRRTPAMRLSAVSGRLLHEPWERVMALVVLTGPSPRLQAAVVSAARMGLAMSRDRVMPALFRPCAGGRLDPLGGDADDGRRQLGVARARAENGDDWRGAHQCREQPGAHLHRVLRHHGCRRIVAAAGRDSRRAAWIYSLGGVFPLIGVLFSLWPCWRNRSGRGAVSSVMIVYGLGSIAVGATVALILRWRRAPFFVAPGKSWSPRDRRLP